MKKKETTNLMVKTICARRVQPVKTTREYHVVFAHLFSRKHEKGEKSGPKIVIRTPKRLSTRIPCEVKSNNTHQ